MNTYEMCMHLEKTLKAISEDIKGYQESGNDVSLQLRLDMWKKELSELAGFCKVQGDF